MLPIPTGLNPLIFWPFNVYYSAQLLHGLSAWCVRLSRLSVGFRTHFKSTKFYFIIHFIHSTAGDKCLSVGISKEARPRRRVKGWCNSYRTCGICGSTESFPMGFWAKLRSSRHFLKYEFPGSFFFQELLKPIGAEVCLGCCSLNSIATVPSSFHAVEQDVFNIKIKGRLSRVEVCIENRNSYFPFDHGNPMEIAFDMV